MQVVQQRVCEIGRMHFGLLTVWRRGGQHLPARSRHELKKGDEQHDRPSSGGQCT